MMEVFLSLPNSITSLTLADVVILIIALIIEWIIVSIPVWLAGKLVTGGKGTFGDAMLATLFGPVVFIIIFFIVGYFLGAVIGSSAAYVFAYVLAFIGWVWVYKASFRTGWLSGLAIAVLAIIILIIINAILGFIFGATLPSFFFPWPH